MEEKRSSRGDIYRGLCTSETVKCCLVTPLAKLFSALVLCKEKQVTHCSLCFLSLEMMRLPTTSAPPVGWKPLGFLESPWRLQVFQE